MANRTRSTPPKPSRQVVTTADQLAALLRSRRRVLGISQAELAAKLNISQGRLSMLETRPAELTLARLLALAKMLGFELVVQERSEPTSEW